MSNQYTLAREAGIGPGDEQWPKQAETRREHPEEVRARIRAGHAIGKLEAILDDPEAANTEKISAAKILLDKTISSLSSSDIGLRDDGTENPEQTEAKLRMLINKADPALLSRLGFKPHLVSDQDQALDTTVPGHKTA